MSSVISDFAERYKLPPELTRFIDEGFLAPLSDNWEEKSIKFHIPSKTVTDSHGRTTSFSVVWIHPDFNREFCHYFDKQPGDIPNFYVIKDTTDLCHEPIDEVNTFDDLVGWLESMKSADVQLGNALRTQPPEAVGMNLEEARKGDGRSYCHAIFGNS